MRTVGRRQPAPPIEAVASSDALRRGLAVVDAAASFGWATSTGQSKGVYRFKSFEAMEEHRIDCLVQAIALRASTSRSLLLALCHRAPAQPASPDRSILPRRVEHKFSATGCR